MLLNNTHRFETQDMDTRYIKAYAEIYNYSLLKNLYFIDS